MPSCITAPQLHFLSFSDCPLAEWTMSATAFCMGTSQSAAVSTMLKTLSLNVSIFARSLMSSRFTCAFHLRLESGDKFGKCAFMDIA
jgi:hypothetical protein